MNRRFFTCWLMLLWAFFFLGKEGLAQSPFQLDAKVDAPLSLFGGISLGTSFLLHKKKPSLTELEIKNLNPLNINAFDRSATERQSKLARKLSDVLLYGAHVSPFLLAADPKMRKDFGTISFMGFETFLVNMGITALTKEVVKRKRPFVYNPAFPMSMKMKKDATSSFPSGHTSSVAVSSFFMASMLNAYYPNSNLKPLWWTGAGFFPALTALFRYLGGKHFFSDVLVGYLVGAGVGILVPALHRR